MLSNPLPVALLSALLTFSVTAANEIPVASPLVVPAYGDQRPVDAASNGDSALMIWDGGRAGTLGTLVSVEGELQRPPIAIDSAEPSAASAVASDGSSYLVVSSRNGQLIANTVSAAGEAGTSRPIGLAPLSPGRIDSAAAWNGQRYLVVWRAPDNASLSAALVSPDGVAGQPFTLAIDANTFDVASDGNNFLLAFSSGAENRLGTIVVDRFGQAGAPTFIPSSRSQIFRSSLVWTGTAYFLLWDDSTFDFAVTNSAFLDRTGYPIAGAIGMPKRMNSPAVVAANGGADVFYVDGLSIAAVHVNVDGLLSGPDPLIDLASDISPLERIAATTIGARPFIAWNDRRDIFGAILASTSVPLDGDSEPDGTVLSVSWPMQQRPAVAEGRGVRVVVWQELKDDSMSVMMGRVDRNGRPLDGAGIRLSDPLKGGYGPDVATNGQSFLLAWIEDGRAQSITLDSTGDPSSASPKRPLSEEGSADFVRLIPIADGYAITYSVVVPGPLPVFYSHRMFFRRLDRRGEPVGPSVSFAEGGGQPAIAWTGNGFVTLTQDREFHCTTRGCPAPPDLQIHELSQDGTPLGTPTLLTFTPTEMETGPDIAWKDGKAIVVFTRIRPREPWGFTMQVKYDLMKVVVDQHGFPLTPVEPLSEDPMLDAYNARVVSVPSGFEVVWVERATWDATVGYAEDTRIMSATLDPAGVVTHRRVLIDSPKDDFDPYIATGPSGNSVLVYSRFAPERGAGVASRVFLHAPSSDLDRRRRPAALP